MTHFLVAAWLDCMVQRKSQDPLVPQVLAEGLGQWTDTELRQHASVGPPSARPLQLMACAAGFGDTDLQRMECIVLFYAKRLQIISVFFVQKALPIHGESTGICERGTSATQPASWLLQCKINHGRIYQQYIRISPVAFLHISEVSTKGKCKQSHETCFYT